jgi:hypothetical protein
MKLKSVTKEIGDHIWDKLRAALTPAEQQRTRHVQAALFTLQNQLPDRDVSAVEIVELAQYIAEGTVSLSTELIGEPDEFRAAAAYNNDEMRRAGVQPPPLPPVVIREQLGLPPLVTRTELYDAAMSVATHLQKLADKGATNAIVASYSASSLGWSRLAQAMLPPVKLAQGGPVQRAVGEQKLPCTCDWNSGVNAEQLGRIGTARAGDHHAKTCPLYAPFTAPPKP